MSDQNGLAGSLSEVKDIPASLPSMPPRFQARSRAKGIVRPTHKAVNQDRAGEDQMICIVAGAQHSE
jgi:hypothetical protein